VDWLLEPFTLGFMQGALVAGLLAAVTASLVGTWMVLRGLSFLGDALAHGVLPGIALGVLAGFDLTLGAVISAVIMVVGINLVHRFSRLSEDTAIGLLFVGMLALGVVIISRTASYTGSLTGILFGDALGTTGTDLLILGVGAVISAALSVILYRSFLALAFNEQKARLLGLQPRLAHLAMLTLVTMAVVTSFRTVGTLLVFGLLIAPPATAALVARRVPMMMLVALATGALSVVGGLVVSYHANTASSATIAGLAVALFFLVMSVRRLIEFSS
jgi:ABC-type Mn2+/Zn2+ transport system permease subunit